MLVPALLVLVYCENPAEQPDGLNPLRTRVVFAVLFNSFADFYLTSNFLVRPLGELLTQESYRGLGKASRP